MFIDKTRIEIKAGSGGNGCNSMFRTKVMPYGRADGGYGGSGGNVIIKTSKSIHTLLDFHFNKHFTAEDGKHGGSNHKTGKRGKELTILVPCGTLIKDTVNGFVLRDLVIPDDSVIIARGGAGGHGNSRFRKASPGEPGEKLTVTLELKMIADVGIIGFPNAGKSTFISSISRVKSKVADYPFTTKHPILGIVERHEHTLTFADMPGLIDGAHEGKGLGDRFLRHIERTRILLHLVDVSCFERPDPYKDYLAINNELNLYSEDVANKTKIVVLNKVDVDDAMETAKKLAKKIDEKVFIISAVTGEGVDKLLDYIFKISFENAEV